MGWIGVALMPSTPALAQSGAVIRDIQVTGAQRIEPETVESYLLIKRGDRFDSGRLDRSLKNLFGTGLFADVSVVRTGDMLQVKVVENPIVNEVAFEGNDRIKDENLASEVTLRSRVIYTRPKVQADVRRMLTLYRRSGRFAATVEPKVIKLDQNRVNLVFEIDEGPVTEIRNIRFIGNRAFSDGRLREVVRTRETRWYNFLTSDDNYDPDRVAFDKELIRRHYLENGFADIEILSAVAELAQDEQGFYLTYTLDEGRRYRLGAVETVVRLKDLKEEDIEGLVTIEDGDWYDSSEVDETVDALTSYISELGYSFVQVEPAYKKDGDKRTIDISFQIKEGPRLFVERIDISGNVRTQDEVIRREFRIVEGDAFNPWKMERSKRRLEALDYFESLTFEQAPGSAPDKGVVDVKVEEKSTGSLSFGFGFSTDSGPLGDVTLTERNLLGKGQNLRASFVLAAEKSQIDLSFTEPYFMDREVTAGFDIMHVERDYQDTSSYDMKLSGGTVRASYPITERLDQTWRYSLRRSNFTNIGTSASIYVTAQAGLNWLSEVSHSLTYDRRDRVQFPTEGYVLGTTNAVAGFGGDSQYVNNIVFAENYYPITDDWIFMLGGKAGYIWDWGNALRLNERYFLGGATLRGFENAGVGPRDTATGDALGGQAYYLGTAEVRFPLGLPEELQITGRAFTDIGSLWNVSDSGPTVVDDSALRGAAGIGITWISPMGPIGIDLATPFLEEAYDKTELFRVNFGTRF